MSRFTGRVALVTGAASGIGKQVALRFAAEGAVPVIADLNLDAAAATAKEIKAKGGDAFAVAMNVVDEAQVEKGVADTVAKYGKIDILVSNAGIQIVRPLVDFPFTDWKKLLAIHLDGAFLTTRACLKHMYAAKYGRVIYMGSVHSKEASKLKAPYVTAKHGLIGLAKVLAKEGAEYNVSANVVCPGFVRTPLVDKQIPEQAEALKISEEDVIKKVMLKDTVDGEFTTTDEVADAVLYFAAASSTALTGQSIVDSHGWFRQETCVLSAVARLQRGGRFEAGTCDLGQLRSRPPRWTIACASNKGTCIHEHQTAPGCGGSFCLARGGPGPVDVRLARAGLPGRLY